MQINLIQHDAAFNFVQSIDMYRKVAGGHANLATVEDVSGGYKGGSFELSVSSRDQAMRIQEGHCFSAWQDGWPVYAGRVMEVDNTGDGWRIGMMGLIELFGQSIADISYYGQPIYAIFRTLLTNIGFNAQLSTNTEHIGLNYYVAGEVRNSLGQLTKINDLKFFKTNIKNIWDTCNAFSGWEYGSVLWDTFDLKNAKTIMYYQPPDTTTLTATIDAASLKSQPILKPDFRQFGNWVRVYYGQAGLYEDIHGKVITSIDLAADTVTITDHGFATGDAIRVYNQNGAYLLAPLALNTTYYAIRINANEFKFATSLANANAGIAINLTTAGTRIHSVGYYPDPSEVYYGETYFSVDAGSESSTATDAGAVGQACLDGFLQDGMARPPVTVDITLDDDTHIENPRGNKIRNIWRQSSGRNVMLMNLPDVVIRDLQNLAQPAFVHVLEMQRDYGAGQVKLRCRRGFDPAVILARAKGM